MNIRAANRYAKALLDLALEKKQEDLVNKDMQFVAETIAENSELEMLISSPIYRIADKKMALTAVFDKKISALSNNLIDLLATNKRMSLFQTIANQYSILYNEVKKIVKASVITAIPLDDEMRKQILTKAQALAKNKEINLESNIDESIIGGFILRVGDVQIDASILNKLNNLKRELKE